MLVAHDLDDLIVSAAITGTPASWLRPSLVANGLDPDDLRLPSGERNYSAGDAALRRWRDLWAAGQGIGSVRAVEPVAAVVDRLADEYAEALARARMLADRPGTASS